jgi:hypothetical protein
MKAAVILLTFTVAASVHGAEIYECVDPKGNLRFTNRWGDSTAGCKRINLPSAQTSTKQPQVIQAEALNAATHALVDPDESVRERAQQDLDKEIRYYSGSNTAQPVTTNQSTRPRSGP